MIVGCAVSSQAVMADGLSMLPIMRTWDFSFNPPIYLEIISLKTNS